MRYRLFYDIMRVQDKGGTMLRQLRDWLHRRIERRWACPGCGERDSDRLVWIDETISVICAESIECQRCGTVYVP